MDWEKMAQTAQVQAQASYEAHDTDGALSQWGKQMQAELYSALADLEKSNNQATFPALFDLEGNYVPSRLTLDRWGKSVFMVFSKTNGLTYAPAYPKRASTLTRKGYTQGLVVKKATAKLHGEDIVHVRAIIVEAQSPYDAPIEVVYTDIFQLDPEEQVENLPTGDIE